MNKHKRKQGNQTERGAYLTEEEERSHQSEGEVERDDFLLFQRQGSTAGFT